VEGEKVSISKNGGFPSFAPKKKRFRRVIEGWKELELLLHLSSISPTFYERICGNFLALKKFKPKI
jgi:hypothetical protein